MDNQFEKIGKDTSINVKQLKVGKNVIIDDRVSIHCNKLVIGDNVQIKHDVLFVADSITIGFNSTIEERVKIERQLGEFFIGENTIIGHDTKLTVPKLKLGDYVTINNHCMFSGNEPLILGHNAWIGQNCVLNSQQELTIGNNFGLGMYSCIYTHGYFGELLEGCNIYKEEAVSIGDDVWVLGQFNMISPGVDIGNKTLILNGSNVTRNVPSDSTVGGSPARDLTDKLQPYRQVSLIEKFDLMGEFITQWLNKNYSGNYQKVEGGFEIIGIGKILLVNKNTTVQYENVVLIITTDLSLIENDLNGVSIFDLKTKMYNRTRSIIEIDFIRFMKAFRARFVPSDQPRVAFK